MATTSAPVVATAGAGAAPLEKKQIPIVCPGHTRPLADLQFCQVDGGGGGDNNNKTTTTTRTFLVSACHDRLPMMRDGRTGDWIGTWSGHKGAVWSCRLDRTGSLAATASGDFSVQVWDAIAGGPSIWTYVHLHVVKACDFSPDSTRLATGGNEGILRIFDLTQQENQTEPVVPWEIGGKKGSAAVVPIGKLIWLNDTQVFTGCKDGSVRFWDLSQIHNATDAKALQPFRTLQTEDGAEIRDMELTSAPVVSVTTDGLPTRILTVATGTKVIFFNLDDYSVVRSYKMPIHFRDEGGASLHPSGKKFIAGGSDLWVRVFDFDSGAQLECLKGHHGPIRCLRYSPTGDIYATGSEDGTIRLWQDAVA